MNKERKKAKAKSRRIFKRGWGKEVKGDEGYVELDKTLIRNTSAPPESNEPRKYGF
jgi:hypothetical protein